MSAESFPRPMPPDFRRALRRSGLLEYFIESVFVHRAAYLSWIAESRMARTRRAKIAQAVLRLAAQRREDVATIGEMGCGGRRYTARASAGGRGVARRAE